MKHIQPISTSPNRAQYGATGTISLIVSIVGAIAGFLTAIASLNESKGGNVDTTDGSTEGSTTEGGDEGSA